MRSWPSTLHSVSRLVEVVVAAAFGAAVGIVVGWLVLSDGAIDADTVDVLVAVGAIATAVGTLVLAGATFDLARKTRDSVSHAREEVEAARGQLAIARQQNETARDALEAQTQPLLTEVPRGRSRSPTWYDDETGKPRHWRDDAEIMVGAGGGPEVYATAYVPVWNVGNGAARIQEVTFRTSGEEAHGRAENPILPPGEVTRVLIAAAEDDAGFRVAASIGMEYENFSVQVSYADASGRPRGTLSCSRVWMLPGSKRRRRAGFHAVCK